MLLFRLLYKPFAIIGALVAGRIGRSLFRSLWSKIDDAPPPKPGSGEAGTAKVVGAEALQAGVMAGTAAAVDHTVARFFHHIIGVWPGKPAKSDDA